MGEIQDLLSAPIPDQHDDSQWALPAAQVMGILDHMSDALYVVDKQWCITYVNRKVEELWGCRRSDLLGKNIWEAFPYIVGTSIYHALLDAMQERRSVAFEHLSPVIHRWFDVRVYPSRTGLIVYAIDISERKQTEEALRLSEEKFRLAIKAAGLGAWDFDPQTGKLDWSDEHKAMFGLPPTAEVTLDTFFGGLHPDDHASIEASYQKNVASVEGSINDTEYRVIGYTDGKERWLAGKGQAYFDEQGNCVRFIGIVQDITARKQAEIERERLLAELEESRHLFQRIAETSPDALYVYDLDIGRSVYISARSEQVNGYPSEKVQALGDRFATTHWHPDDVPSLLEHRRKLRELADGEIYENEHRLLQPDGTYRWLRTRTSVFARAADGHVRQIIGVTQDITARKRAEEELHKQKEILQTIFDHIPVMIRFGDQDGRIQLINREWERTLGWSLEEIQQPCLDLYEQLYPDPQERQRARQFGAEATGEWTDFRLRVRDGRAVDVTFACIRLADGMTIGIGQDITARKRAEEELRAQKEILHTILDHIPVMIRFHSEDGRHQFVNRAYERTLGWSPEEIQHYGTALLAECYPEPQEHQRVLKHIAASNGEWADFKTRVRDGQVIDTSWAVVGLADAFIIAIGQDITARKRAEEALRRAHDDLEAKVAERTRELAEANAALRVENAERRRAEHAQQRLLQQLVRAQEDERRHLARELHDSLGQRLTVLHLGLKAVQKRDDCPASVADGIQELRELTLRIDEDLDRLIFELRPPALDDLGLDAALRLLIKEWTSTSQIPVDIHTSGLNHQRLPMSIETTVYRVIQEALTNILKHAQATRVSVIVNRRGREVRAIIEDNGRGFELAAVGHTPGAGRQLGIKGMEERATLAGGSFEIETAPGAGTTVYLHIPLPPDN